MLRVPYNCYEVAHPWNVNCAESSLKLFLHCYEESLKIYTPLYVASLIYGRQFDKQNLVRTLQSILTSSTFLSINAGSFLACFCTIRQLTGNFSLMSTACTPGFVASLLAILVERPARRKQLAVYTCNMASEVIYNMIKFRGWITPIPHFEKFMFAVSAGVYLWLCQKGHTHPNDPVKRMFQFVVGDDEFTKGQGVPAHEVSISGNQLQQGSGDHQKSLHNDVRSSCYGYVVQGFARSFFAGWLLRAVLCLIATQSLSKTIRYKEAYKFGMFLGSFGAIFRGVNCFLRYRGYSPQNRAGIAGCLAALSMFFSGSPSMALYLAWKALEGAYGAYGRPIPGASELLYSLSTAMLFYAAVFEPHNLRPTYWKFMNRISYDRFTYVNRKIFDMYGVQSSKLFGDFWPRLDMDHVSKELTERILIWVPF
ncbi:transmembrane protein 135-like isoform X2 [Varroa jacobsoni]|uniref:transmembrane protein 135-like isoform X2 n=1 Tax=Varroa jacobsoni TaxID=62625 RepID=UPI000BF5BB51|nr:transmembrane protein 135-like isoform X2 [Varroa jacobsoni]